MDGLKTKAKHYMKLVREFDVKKFVKHHRKLVLYGILAVIAVILLIPVVTYIYFVRDLSSKDTIINKKNEGVILLDRNEKPFYTLFDARTKHPVDISTLHRYTAQAFIAVEDKDFYRHPGFSISGIGRAIRENLMAESFAQGGSTISQQLIKTAILSPDKRLLRKYQELVLALELERKFSKDDILEMYMNTIYFGEGAFGIEDASQRYFSKDAKDLTVAESALLAGIVQAPSAYSPISGDVQKAGRRKDIVLTLMQQQGYLTQDEKDSSLNEEIKLNPKEEEVNTDVIHFAQTVQEALIKEYGEQRVAQSGFVVKTTLDSDLQKTAQAAVKAQVARLTTSKVSNGAAVVIEPKTAQVMALVGSHDWTDEDNGRINMTLRPRQPGSSFKPIIYAKALEDRDITPSTQLEDKAMTFGTYKPKNYDNRFRGKVLVRYALANSLNIPAILIMQKVGVPDGVKTAEALGITSLDEKKDYGLPFVLGSAEVPLIEMTNAYATFANEGEWQQYVTYTEVRDKNGKKVEDNQPDKKRALSSATSFLISSILSDNKARAESFGGALNLSRTAAVKTGTTNDYRDALTIGYTPQIAVGVWIGNNDNTPMNSIAGSLGAAPIWRQIMEAYLKGKPVENFQRPVDVVEEKVCLEDGNKVEFATSSAYPEFFLRGSAPTEKCGLMSPTPSPEPTNSDVNDRNGDGIPDSQQGEGPTAVPEPTSQSQPTNTPQPNQQPTNTPVPFVTVPITPLLPTSTPTP